MYEWLVSNLEVFRLVYTLIILLVCVIIVLKTDKLFRLSLHQGIRYFRNAFFFFGLAFLFRYLLSGAVFIASLEEYQMLLNKFIFEFFIIMAGFFLLYSLIWKKFNKEEKQNSSLLNYGVSLFYALALVIAMLDVIWQTYVYLLVSQMLIFLIAFIIASSKLKKSKGQAAFLKVYLFVIFLNIVMWILNFVVASFLDWNKIGVIGFHLLNILVFLLFLYAVLKATSLRRN